MQPSEFWRDLVAEVGIGERQHARTRRRGVMLVCARFAIYAWVLVHGKVKVPTNARKKISKFGSVEGRAC